jgi:uncharacterized iron-regulated protein
MRRDLRAAFSRLMVHGRWRWRRQPTLCLGLAVWLTLAGCTTPPAANGLVLDKPVVLLGEVHDNAAQHALRLRAFEALLATGARPALALEQFDRQHQAAIDHALAQDPRPDAGALIAIAQGAKGWDWAFYRPFIALALQHQLPIVAANVGPAEARNVMRDGLAAHGFAAEVPAEVLQTHSEQIVASHCGMVKAPAAGRMALAQVARDQFMARVLQAHAGRGVVLLAGNGHVRTDVGAPRWLGAATRQQSVAIGVLENGDSDTPYDRWLHTPVQARPDPCEGMRKK